MSRSVFDFLYQDAIRVGSLLSQFEPNGLLTSLTQTDTFSEASENTTKMDGGITLLAAKGSIAEEDKQAEGISGSAARAFDPRWANSLNLLTFLQNEGMLHRNLASTGLGRIVLVSGTLEIFDVPLLKQMFSDMNVIRAVMETEGKKYSALAWQQHKKSFGIIAALPLSVQLMMTCDQLRIWAVLDEACLQTSATNLFLKYGSRLFGTWHMLGILDATPDPAEVAAEIGDEGSAESAMDLMRHLDSLHRKLGRPKSAYSLTPLLIFRDLLREQRAGT